MEHYLRKLARSNRWQMLYSKAKQIASIKMFMNDFNFSNKQLAFLYWLSLYNSLYQDLASKGKYLTKEVIDDDIECDAYLHYKATVSPEKEKKVKKQGVSGIPSLVRKA